MNMNILARATIPRLRAGFQLPSHYRIDALSTPRHSLPTLITAATRHYHNPLASSSPRPSRRRVILRRSYTVITTLLAIYGLVHIYDATSTIYDRATYYPIFYERLRRAIAREVDMDDLNEAMDHFVDIYGAVNTARMGFHDSDLQDNILDHLQGLAWVAHPLGPEVFGDFLYVIKQACADVRTIKLAEWDDNVDNLDMREAALEEIQKRLNVYVIKMERHLIPKMKVVVAEADEKLEHRVEIIPVDFEHRNEPPTDSPRGSEWTPID